MTKKKEKQVSVNFDDLVAVLNSTGFRSDSCAVRLVDTLLPDLSDAQVLSICDSKSGLNGNIINRILSIVTKHKTLSHNTCCTIFYAIDGGGISFSAKQQKMTEFSANNLKIIIKAWPNMLDYIADVKMHKWFLTDVYGDKGAWADYYDDTGYDEAGLIEFAKKALSKKDLADYLACGKALAEKHNVWSAA